MSITPDTVETSKSEDRAVMKHDLSYKVELTEASQLGDIRSYNHSWIKLRHYPSSSSAVITTSLSVTNYFYY